MRKIDEELINASKEGKYDDVVRLIKEGADVNAEGFTRSTPLHFSVGKGNIEIVRLLIEQGADVNKGDFLESKPLHLAVETENLEMIKLLVAKGADVNCKRKNTGNTPIHEACVLGNLEIVNYLLKEGANLNIKNYNGVSPLEFTQDEKIREKITESLKFKKLILEIRWQEILLNLLEMGYFKYVFPENTEGVIEEVKNNFINNGTLSAKFESSLSYTNDYREYHADCEDLAEGNVGSTIKDMNLVLEKEGIILKDIREDFDYDKGKYNISINGKLYNIWQKGKEPWGRAYRMLIEIVNDLFVTTSSKERLYGQHYLGNDSKVVFLTEELFTYIKKIDLDFFWMPATIDELVELRYFRK